MKQRFEKLWFILTEKLTLYPILTGILFLANELRNNAIFYTIQENISLILIISVFTIGVDLLSRKLIRDKTKAALIATFFIILNLFYLDILQFVMGEPVLINPINSHTSSHPEIIILPVIFTAWFSFTLLIIKTKRLIAGLNLYLNVLFILFILLELVKVYAVPIPQVKLTENEPLPVNLNLTNDQKPDIYYIILDAHTSSESLKKYWKYDNSGFEDSLKTLGFSIAAKSKSDFAFTPYCLASYLNSSSLILDTTKQYNERNLFQLIRNNRLLDWLKTNDYLYYNFSGFDIDGKPHYFNTFYYNHFLGRTLWYKNSIQLYHYLVPSSRIPQTNLNIFNELNHQAVKNENKPIFTYAHIMSPHEPFYFNEHGVPYKASDSLSEKQKYLGQLIFTDSLIMKTINHILSIAKRKPIIIIQGDHGFRYLNDTIKQEQLHEAHTMFFAICSPYDSIVINTHNPATTFIKVIERINKLH